MEPVNLKKGKVFHKLIQKEWEETAEGIPMSEKTIKKQSGRRGRVDILVDDDDPDGTAAIVEIKATDWDAIAEKNVRRNVRRQIKQIWDYIESQIYQGEYVTDGLNKSISPGIIFPSKPKDEERLKFIEEILEHLGLWTDKQSRAPPEKKESFIETVYESMDDGWYQAEDLHETFSF